ncbi:MAG: hypothetical protein R3E98_04035 [Gemmatimonadota bacterium]
MTHRDEGLDPELEALVEEARADYHPPPPTPREAMWEGVRARLEETAAPASAPPARASGRRGASLVWRVLAASVVLALGVGLGRWSVQRTAPPQAAPVAGVGPAAGAPRAAPAGPSERVLRFAAFEHLSETQQFLSALDTTAVEGGDVSAWGTRLLTDTRLLLDTPASEDPELRRLLEDLELVLAQVVQLTATRGEAVERVEVETFREGLREQQVLPRIRRLLPPVIGADD